MPTKTDLLHYQDILVKQIKTDLRYDKFYLSLSVMCILVGALLLGFGIITSSWTNVVCDILFTGIWAWAFCKVKNVLRNDYKSLREAEHLKWRIQNEYQD